MISTVSEGRAGGCFGVTSSPLARRHPPLSFLMLTAHESSRQNIDLVSSCQNIILPRQWRVSRASVGAKRPVRRGTSLGRGDFLNGSRSNESCENQSTLHVAKRPTDDDGVHLQELDSNLAFALLTPSESNVVETKARSRSTSERY